MSDEATQRRNVRRLALGLGALAGCAVLFTLADPGITVDEPLDVLPGRTYVATLRARGLHFFDADVVDRVFRDNAEHPPLGRWLLGFASTLGEPIEVLLMGGPDPVGLYVNDKLVAYGEVVVVEDHFGIKITELVGSGPQG